MGAAIIEPSVLASAGTQNSVSEILGAAVVLYVYAAPLFRPAAPTIYVSTMDSQGAVTAVLRASD